MIDVILFILEAIVVIIVLFILIWIIKIIFYMASFVFLSITKSIGWIIVWGIAIWILINLL